VHALKLVCLAGGVGGSRLARGLHLAAPSAHLTAIVNTGDDLTLYGLRISPDVDTMLYTLSGTVDERRGWGPRADSERCMRALARLGSDTWFTLGDLDLATHLRRTELLQAGLAPGAVTAELARRLGLDERLTILPMTDDRVETWVQLARDEAWVHFQHYFVRERAQVPIRAVRFEGIDRARPAPGVLEALAAAEAVVLCPSNPFVSLAPILAVPGVREAVLRARRRGARVVGVSPIIGGATVKGPAARMLVELGHTPSAAAVAQLYADLLDAFLIDTVDRELAAEVARLGIEPIVADILMRGRRGAARLGRLVLRSAAA
jgi:LPPG:FO 2-phospho-L-lactate transferase